MDILNIIEEILVHDGPDGHVDGSEIIVEFINALMAGKGEAWFENYISGVEPRAGCSHDT